MRVSLKEWRKSSSISTRLLILRFINLSIAQLVWTLRSQTKCSSKLDLWSIRLSNFQIRTLSNSSIISTSQLRNATFSEIQTTRISFLAMTLPETSGQERRSHTTWLSNHIPSPLALLMVTFWLLVVLTPALLMSQDQCLCTIPKVKTVLRKHPSIRTDIPILWHTRVISCMLLVEDRLMVF